MDGPYTGHDHRNGPYPQSPKTLHEHEDLMPYTHHSMLQRPGTLASTAKKRAKAAERAAARASTKATKASSSPSPVKGNATPKKKAAPGAVASPWGALIDEEELMANLPDWISDTAHSEVKLEPGGWASLGNIPLNRDWHPEDESILLVQIDFGRSYEDGPLAYMAGVAIYQTEEQLLVELLIDHEQAEEDEADEDELTERSTSVEEMDRPGQWKRNKTFKAIAAEAGTALPELQSAIWGWVLVGMKRLLIAAQDGTTYSSEADIAKAWGSWLMRHAEWAQQPGSLWSAATLRPLLTSKVKAVREVGIVLMGQQQAA